MMKKTADHLNITPPSVDDSVAPVPRGHPSRKRDEFVTPPPWLDDGVIF
jgi:hypothetical protein